LSLYEYSYSITYNHSYDTQLPTEYIMTLIWIISWQNCLVNPISENKQFHLCWSNTDGIMKCFLQWTVEWVNVSNRSGYIVHDASDWDDNNHIRFWWCIKYDIFENVAMTCFSLIKVVISFVKWETTRKKCWLIFVPDKVLCLENKMIEKLH